jgi:hypothetical protein
VLAAQAIRIAVLPAPPRSRTSAGLPGRSRASRLRSRSSRPAPPRRRVRRRSVREPLTGASRRSRRRPRSTPSAGWSRRRSPTSSPGCGERAAALDDYDRRLRLRGRKRCRACAMLARLESDGIVAVGGE